MKVLTILGTRPEIIRLSRVIPRLDEVVGRENHILVHTGQNYDPTLSQVFFEELGIRKSDHCFDCRGSFGDQMARLFPYMEAILLRERPDRVLILGDTNSSLAAIVAARMHIPVYHMEAGNRSFDPRSPEEVNRRLIDHCAAIHLPYTERARQNLLAEGIHSSRIFVTGNPIHEVVEHYGRQIDNSDIFNRLEIERGRYFLVTLHREENVDHSIRLGEFLHSFDLLLREYKMPMIVSTHPRTRKQIGAIPLKVDDLVNLAMEQPQFVDPFSFFDFIALQKNAFCVLSDSGTVQEESCLLHVPSVTLRDTTERPETVECGASVLSGADPARIVELVGQVTAQKPNWQVPPEYMRENVADTVVRILTSHYSEGAR